MQVIPSKFREDKGCPFLPDTQPARPNMYVAAAYHRNTLFHSKRRLPASCRRVKLPCNSEFPLESAHAREFDQTAASLWWNKSKWVKPFPLEPPRQGCRD